MSRLPAWWLVVRSVETLGAGPRALSVGATTGPSLRETETTPTSPAVTTTTLAAASIHPVRVRVALGSAGSGTVQVLSSGGPPRHRGAAPLVVHLPGRGSTEFLSKLGDRSTQDRADRSGPKVHDLRDLDIRESLPIAQHDRGARAERQDPHSVQQPAGRARSRFGVGDCDEFNTGPFTSSLTISLTDTIDDRGTHVARRVLHRTETRIQRHERIVNDVFTRRTIMGQQPRQLHSRSMRPRVERRERITTDISIRRRLDAHPYKMPPTINLLRRISAISPKPSGPVPFSGGRLRFGPAPSAKDAFSGEPNCRSVPIGLFAVKRRSLMRWVVPCRGFTNRTSRRCCSPRRSAARHNSRALALVVNRGGRWHHLSFEVRRALQSSRFHQDAIESRSSDLDSIGGAATRSPSTFDSVRSSS